MMHFSCQSCSCPPFPVESFPATCACGAIAESSDSPLIRAGDAPKRKPVRDECEYRGREARQQVCESCNGRDRLKVFACGLHGECTIAKEIKGVQCCATCDDRPTVPRGADGQPVITAAVTYYWRPEDIGELLASLHRFHPDLPIEIMVTDGNLSRGRNRLYERIETPYLLMLEEDFVLTGPLPLQQAIEIIERDEEIQGVGGSCLQDNGSFTHVWAHNFDGGMDKITEATERRTVGKTEYTVAELILNFGVFDTRVFVRHLWDEARPVMEHREMYWRMSRSGERFAYLPGMQVAHKRSRPNKHYIRMRERQPAQAR